MAFAPKQRLTKQQRAMLVELLLNLPFIHSLDTRFKYVQNEKSGKVHLTVDSCIPAISMRLERRLYSNDFPSDGEWCGFCEKKYLHHREEANRDYRN